MKSVQSTICSKRSGRTSSPAIRPSPGSYRHQRRRGCRPDDLSLPRASDPAPAGRRCQPARRSARSHPRQGRLLTRPTRQPEQNRDRQGRLHHRYHRHHHDREVVKNREQNAAGEPRDAVYRVEDPEGGSAGVSGGGANSKSRGRGKDKRAARTGEIETTAGASRTAKAARKSRPRNSSPLTSSGPTTVPV